MAWRNHPSRSTRRLKCKYRRNRCAIFTCGYCICSVKQTRPGPLSRIKRLNVQSKLLPPDAKQSCITYASLMFFLSDLKVYMWTLEMPLSHLLIKIMRINSWDSTLLYNKTSVSARHEWHEIHLECLYFGMGTMARNFYTAW